MELPSKQTLMAQDFGPVVEMPYNRRPSQTASPPLGLVIGHDGGRNTMKRIGLAFLLIAACLAYAPAYAQNHYVVGESHFGCGSKDYFSKLVGYAVDKDIEAFKKGLAVGLLTGQCTLFKNGETVFVTDTSIFSGLVQVRRKGDTTTYWTNMETVK